MTAPNQGDPNGALNPGDFAGFQAMTQADAETAMTSGAKVSIGSAYDSHNTNVTTRINDNYTLVVQAQGSADQAVTTAQAAANSAANSETVADKAYANASFWSVECVVASAEVLLGVNELLLGPVLNVPDSQNATLTDVHIALLEQYDGMTIDIRKWDAEGLTYTTVATAIIDPNQTRANVRLLAVPVYDKERFFYYVTSVTGSVPPTVLQCAVAGNFTLIEE